MDSPYHGLTRSPSKVFAVIFGFCYQPDCPRLREIPDCPDCAETDCPLSSSRPDCPDPVETHDCPEATTRPTARCSRGPLFARPDCRTVETDGLPAVLPNALSRIPSERLVRWTARTAEAVDEIETDVLPDRRESPDCPEAVHRVNRVHEVALCDCRPDTRDTTAEARCPRRRRGPTARTASRRTAGLPGPCRGCPSRSRRTPARLADCTNPPRPDCPRPLRDGRTAEAVPEAQLKEILSTPECGYCCPFVPLPRLSRGPQSHAPRVRATRSKNSQNMAEIEAN
jgi:hypothetical protein